MQIPNYVFDARLYEGKTTLVYAGVREADRTPVVGKMVLGGVRDLRSELGLMQRLSGPGIVEAFGVFDSSNGPVLVQRRFGDGSLADALHERGAFDLRTGLQIARALAEVLARLHAQRILHRDIKPANVLFDSATGEIALADFGIAVELPLGARSLPVADLIGTPRYFAPEQTGRTNDGVDARSDLYSLGITLYELFVGTPPFGDGELLELVAAHLSRVPEAPARRRPELPGIVSDIVMKLIEKAPAQRYQSARGLAADLVRCLETLDANGAIPAFVLGGSDLVRPRSSMALYGRELERARFGGAVARAASGIPSVVLVSGPEGTGRNEFARTMLGREARDSLAALGSWKTAGERPLAGWIDAESALAGQLLLLDDEHLKALRARVLAQVGSVGQALIDVVPALADVLGPQPALTPLGPAEARARMQHALLRFTAALGEEQLHVLGLFNVDHADEPSLQLVQALLAASEGGRLLVVLTAQDAERFGALRSRPNVEVIELGPLSLESVTSWTAELLGLERGEVVALAEVLFERSAGNPKLLSTLVEHFIEVGVIVRSDGRFTWSLDDVRTAKPPLSAGILAARRVHDLTPLARALLAAVADGGEESDLATLAAMVESTESEVLTQLTTLERTGLTARSPRGGYVVAHPAIAETVDASVDEADRKRASSRLALHLLRTLGKEEQTKSAYRIASALHRGDAIPVEEMRLEAALLFAQAAEQATATMAYERAATFSERGLSWLGESGWDQQRSLMFRLSIGLARALIMLGAHDRNEQLLTALSERDLSPSEIGIVVPMRADSYTAVQKRDRAIETGLEGLARLGFPVPPDLTMQQAVAPLMQNQQRLTAMTVDEHVSRAEATDASVISAVKIISMMAGPVGMSGRADLYLWTLEQALALNLQHGYTRYYASLLATHAMILHNSFGNFDGARTACDACLAVQQARPAPEIDGRTFLVVYYIVCPWFFPWKDSIEPLARGMQYAVEGGDTTYAAFCASAILTMMAMSGDPLEEIVAKVESLATVIRGDGGVIASADNARNLAGKLSRGEPIEQSDLDRVTNVPLAAGSMRNSTMVNFGLALTVVGHGKQVRAWLEQVRVMFPRANSGQPHLVTLWLLDGLFAAEDAQAGDEARLAVAEAMLANFTKLRDKTKSDNNAPAMTLLEAEIARARHDRPRASGLYGEAASGARKRGLVHLVAYAMERRAQLAEQQGLEDEAALFYREAAIAYRRWTNLTKVHQLEAARPELKTLELSRVRSRDARTDRSGTTQQTHGGTAGTTQAATQSTVNQSLDLETVLAVSQAISTQLSASGVVSSVLAGIAQNAGAERVLFILRSASQEEVAYAELRGGAYRELGVPLNDYPEVPHSAVRLVRRTGKPLILIDAAKDANHASDPFVRASGCRSIAVVPVQRKGALGGFVVLENRLAPGAFTPALVSLTQALVAQAAISLDNASLYEDMESRVRERTVELNARNAEMRLVFDNVSQGLLMVDRERRVCSEPSAIIHQWFPEQTYQTLDGFFASEPLFAASWDQLLDGFLPIELGIDQLPKHLKRGEQILEVAWQPILDERGELARMLVVLSDITEALRRQEAEQEQKQMMAIFERLSQDRSSVVEFAREASNIVREIEHGTGSPDIEKRLVHTLKGNAAFFGLSGLSTLCHEIESVLIEEARQLSGDERAAIAGAWQAINARLSRFLDVGGGYMQVRKHDFESAMRALVREGHPVAQDLELWKLEAFETRFQRIAEQAQALAVKLEKAPLRVIAEHGNFRFDHEAWTPLWAAFVHAIRNAIDHGIEPPDERAALGKDSATLRLRASFDGPLFVLELSDDGRGIAWEKVRSKARSVGLPSETRQDLVDALFADGVSTKERADENSGRGVGMAALRDACTAMEGRISVESEPGRGTTWRFEFPSHVAKLPRERRPSLRPDAAAYLRPSTALDTH